ncbi:right-handed parallel beta-helix repeat-containing protein [Actinomadura terrae]|uniref:right-handed parallel beta-helix repeat-containing protein n=1 Tax=Actinomadura terrae TaxID=604353 RepID=UPI0023430435|nr:right-handed parallel beta-helix repeat-containing protein [Actinomadura terrae]
MAGRCAFRVGLVAVFGLVPAALIPARQLPHAHADTPTETPADAARQAALVDQEDQRIMQTRSVLTAILQIGGQATAQWKRPQIFGSSQGKTLVLPAVNTGKPYTVEDLRRYGGRYFQRLPDGSYLLGIHVFVADGAGLLLQNPSGGPLVIRMGSTAGAFSSIVSFGGNIRIEGNARYPARIFSWDPSTRRPDSNVADGRAYLRAVGGEFRMKYAHVSQLGFWSGRTGGIALTGTDRPASAAKHLNKEQRHANKKKRLEQQRKGGSGGGPGDIEIERPGGTATHVPAADLVTGSIDHSTIIGDAFGLFVSGSNQTQVTNNKIMNSLVNGLVMHRFAKNATIENTVVTGSKGDGFVLSRATEKVRVTNCRSENNGHNGFTVNGQALADGPSASGESLESFGDSSINNSLARNNGHYGIELLGGDKLSVQNSQVIGGDMGIVVRSAATQVQVSGNRLSGQIRQGISLRDGVKGASLAGNTVDGARTGIYMRGSSGTLVGNVIKGATSHGITLVGNAGGSEIRDNHLSGRGTSAVSTSRAHGDIDKSGNDTGGWTDTASLWMKAQRYMTPLNVIWTCVLLMVVITMIRARTGGLRLGRRGAHPYMLQQPMELRPVWRLPRMPRPGQRQAPAPGPAPAPAPAAPAPAQGHVQGQALGQPARPAPAMAGAAHPPAPQPSPRPAPHPGPRPAPPSAPPQGKPQGVPLAAPHPPVPQPHPAPPAPPYPPPWGAAQPEPGGA